MSEARSLTVAKRPMIHLAPEERARIALETLQAYQDGQEIADIAPDYGVSDVTLYALLIRDHEDAWKDAQKSRAVSKRDRTTRDLEELRLKLRSAMQENDEGVKTPHDALSLRASARKRAAAASPNQTQVFWPRQTRFLPRTDGGVFKGSDVEKMRRDLYSAIDRYASAKPDVASTGRVYKVDLPDEHIGKMLDWDKPLSQQPESVRKAIGKIVDRNIDQEPGWAKLTGEQALRAVVERAGRKGDGEKLLRDAGIPGIRYLDQGSRQGGKGTSNYVVFDDSIPRILGRE
jgi:transposase-like protein